MLIRLEVEAGPDIGRAFEIVRPGVFVVGRSSRCDFSLPGDPCVARAHVMVRADAQTRICDIRRVRGAKNACYLDGKAAVSGGLSDGAEIGLGFSKVRVRMDWDRDVAFQHCCECAGEVYLPLEQSEASRVRCERCQAELTKQAVAPDDDPAPAPAFVCCHCQSDVSAMANSDGRAFELLAASEYSCPSCADKDVLQDASSGMRVGEWIALRELGKGGMGAVTLVRHQITGRIAAMKIATDVANRGRFSREMRLLKTFRHPNIVRYLEHVDEASESYLVMQHVRGSDLDDLFLRRGKPYDYETAVALGRDILSALAYMHRHPKGVYLHRDLKPENVLVTETSGRLRPFLTDFGLAKNNKGQTRMTRFGTMMGTCAYSPREQLRDAAGVGPAADVYSIGVLLYYLVSGKYPYLYPSPLEALERAKAEGVETSSRSSLVEIQNRLLAERGFRGSLFDAAWGCQFHDSVQPIPLLERATPEAAPSPIAAIIDRAIRKAPQDRFVDAADMLAAFHSVEPKVG